MSARMVLSRVLVEGTGNRRTWAALVVALCASISGAAVLWATNATACGSFFTRKVLENERRPSLAYEQTLILFDAEKQREHFVREVVFRTAREPFGFVVPTPSRPEVEKVEKSPFPKLREVFPFRIPRAPRDGDKMRRAKGGGGGGAVKVLDVQKVGSFTAFVLKATDARALSDWLSDNQLRSTPEADAWLAHYVSLGFFYVAMRYEPPADTDAAGKTIAETVRLSFDSPLPYYPYLEPDAPESPTAIPPEPRMLDVWLASTENWVPVALRRSAGKERWVRPLLDGDTQGPARTALESVIEPGLLPAGELYVQRFADQKRSRQGFGDIVFVPAQPKSQEGAAKAKLATFMRVLDPSLGASP